MRCMQIQKRLPLILYHELDETGRREIELHLNGCIACSERLAELTSLTRQVPAPVSVPEPDWNEIWQRIERTLPAAKPINSHRSIPLRRRAVAAASLAVVFVLGIVVGRALFFRPAPSHPSNSMKHSPDLTTVLAGHMDSLRPVLIEYSHAEPQSLTVDMSFVWRLLIDNRLLRLRMQKGGDPVIQELLDDIDLVLTEIIHSDPEDRELLSQIGRLIQDRWIPFRINMLKIEDSRLKRL